MEGIDKILVQMISTANRIDGSLWLMEERAFTRYLSRPRASMDEPRVIAPSSLITARGSTAVISVHGVLMKDPWFADETSTTAIEEATRMAGNDEKIDTIVFDVDSPGGSSAGIDRLQQAVEEAAAKKTVIAQSTGMIASGAYWFSSVAHKIYAEKMDWIGSIGVRMDVFDVSRWFANIGIERVAIDTGPLKSTGLFGTEVTEDQRSYLRELVNDTHSHFKAVVQKGRKYNDDQFAAVSTGGVFPASTALRLGLIDGIQSLSQTLAANPRGNSTNQRSAKHMSTNEQTAATLPELRKALPGASNDFLVEQMEANATVEDAMRNHTAAVSAENAKLRQKIEDDKKEKEKAEEEEKKKKDEEARAAAAKSKQQTGGRGNRIGAKADASESAEVDASEADYPAMARELAKTKNISYRQACFEVKRMHPEAREAFKGKPLPV